MYNPIAMQVLNGPRELKEQGFDFGGEKRFQHIFLERSEVVLDEIHDEEYTGLDNQLLLRSYAFWRIWAYSFILSPMTTSRRATVFSCLDAFKV